MKEGVTPKIPNEPARRASRRSPVSSDEDGHCAKRTQIHFLGSCHLNKQTQFKNQTFNYIVYTRKDLKKMTCCHDLKKRTQNKPIFVAQSPSAVIHFYETKPILANA
jgi:hypothetical protein